MEPATVVRSFYERMQDRNWDGAGELLAPSLVIDFTETGERFGRDGFLAMNRAYPEGWTIDVIEILAAGDRVAAQVRVDHTQDVFWCAGFYEVIDGLIVTGTEHWVTEGSQPAPEWRSQYTG